MIRKYNRPLLLGFGVSICLLMAVGLISWLTLSRLLSSDRWVAHSTNVIQKLEQSLSYMKDAETGQRGYLLSGQERFLEPYHGAAERALMMIDQAQKLTSDNPVQQNNLAAIRQTIRIRLAVLQALIEKRRSGRVVLEADLDQGKSAMDALRKAVEKADREEKRLLNVRTENLSHYTALTPVFILLAIILAVLLAVSSYVRIIRDMRHKETLYRELAEEKEEIAALNEELTAANEEISASNEELMAINEELTEARESLAQSNEILEHKVAERTKALSESEMETQALNEELTAINEELTASNEEMTTTNEELFAANESLNDSRERFRFLLNAIPQQVWTATAEGALDYVNEVVSDDFGQAGDVVVGQGWQAFVHPEDLPLALERWLRCLQTGREYVTEFRLKFADGQYYWHLARAVPLIENQRTALWVGTNTNIHQQKTNEYQKDEFLSIASHELKTPLTTIKAFFQLTRREIQAESKMTGFIGKAERQLDRLGRLIEDLLDVSKINAGKMIYNKEDFDFHQMLADMADATQQTAEYHRIELQSEPGLVYYGDQHRIEQVILNLLNNAIKYSPGKDKVIVRCELEQRNIIVSVQDFGIGIPEEHLKGLFDRFYRVDNSSARFQGLGLGLFIANEIVKRHGGSFWIESQPGAGSTFYFLLPLDGQQVFKELNTDGKTFFESSFITIHYRQEGHYLDVDWIGYQNYDSVVRGCTIMLDLLRKNNCSMVLNDNTRVKGNWSEASDWGAEHWFPEMARAGLKQFAWIYSPSTFSRIAANVSLPKEMGSVKTAFFDQKAAAENWLDIKPSGI